MPLVNRHQRRQPLSVFARRASRTITTTLAVVAAVCVGLLIIVLEAPSTLFDIPWVGAILVGLTVLALAILILVGIPWLIIRGVSKVRADALARRIRPGLQRWAAERGWRYERKVIRGKSPADAWRPVENMIVHLREHAKALKIAGVSDEKKTHKITDIVYGKAGPHTAFAGMVHGLNSPEFQRRFLAVEAELHLPPLSVTDRSLDEVWITQRQKFESVDFNQRWRVTAEDPRYASDVVHQRLLALFVDAPLSAERVDLAGGWVVSWLPPGAKEQDLDAHLALLERFVGSVPNFVRSDYR